MAAFLSEEAPRVIAHAEWVFDDKAEAAEWLGNTTATQSAAPKDLLIGTVSNRDRDTLSL